MISDPFILPQQQVDKGAIRFILSGANIMCPGLTSAGAKHQKLPKDSIVVSLNKVHVIIGPDLTETYINCTSTGKPYIYSS